MGAYLEYIEEVDFVVYGTRTEGQGELDVIGFIQDPPQVILCEVATHLGGLQYSAAGHPGTARTPKRPESRPTEQLDRYGISRSVLAALPVGEAVPTNYDELLELAGDSVGRPFIQIPYERAAPGRRWLLKMHGSVRQPKDIVLTRADYLSSGQRRGRSRA